MKQHDKSPNELGKDFVLDPSRELRFPFEPRKKARCILQLINRAPASFVAFDIIMDPDKYHAEPNRGVLESYSSRNITITTLQAQHKEALLDKDVLVVHGVRVSEHLAPDEITQDLFMKASAVYEVILPIVYIE